VFSPDKGISIFCVFVKCSEKLLNTWYPVEINPNVDTIVQNIAESTNICLRYAFLSKFCPIKITKIAILYTQIILATDVYHGNIFIKSILSYVIPTRSPPVTHNNPNPARINPISTIIRKMIFIKFPTLPNKSTKSSYHRQIHFFANPKILRNPFAIYFLNHSIFPAIYSAEFTPSYVFPLAGKSIPSNKYNQNDAI
jgi:hypothetical protein